jgi:RNA polymerase sigma-70 factor, ECF subfamily
VESEDVALPHRPPADADPAELAELAELARIIASSPPGGARAAEAELCRRLAPRVRLYGLRHLRDGEAAADLAQQVLLVTIESLRAGRVREPERIVSFVLGTSRQIVRDGRRNDDRRQALFARYARELPALESAPPSEVDSDRLRDCLDRLSARERSVVVLTFHAERKADEVAVELGLTAGNVRVIRHRALGLLRDCLSPPGGRP